MKNIEIHHVRAFETSTGEVIERCNQCRYAKNFLSDDFSIRHSAFNKEEHRERHRFNRHVHDWKGFRKTHEVTEGKTLHVIRHVTVSAGVSAASTNSAASCKLKQLCSGRELSLAKDIESASTQRERERVADTLGDISRKKDTKGLKLNGGSLQLVGVLEGGDDGLLEKIIDDWSLKNSNYNYAQPVEADGDHKYRLLQRERAATVGTPETFKAWKYIVETYPNNICDRWKNYLLFFEDLGSKPDDKNLIRWRDDGMFEPGNVAWMNKRQAAAERMKRKLVKKKVVSAQHFSSPTRSIA
jgi:hypothetical protein